MADDLGDVDIDDAGNPDDDDEGWETEDEMEAEAEVDDSELTFSKHSGEGNFPRVLGPSHFIESCRNNVCVSRLGVLRQSGPSHQLHGGDGRRG